MQEGPRESPTRAVVLTEAFVLTVIVTVDTESLAQALRLHIQRESPRLQPWEDVRRTKRESVRNPFSTNRPGERLP
jgi:hypothetical protein